MSILTIILFFVYTWGFGFSITFFLKNSENFLERNLIRVGIGLGVFSVVSNLLNLLHIPMDWRIFLILSIILPIMASAKSLLKEAPKINLKLTKSHVYIVIVLLIFLIHFFIFLKGDFLYPYLEDDDSWDHAKSATYVAIEKTAYEPEEFKSLPGHGMFHYLDPYPPSYPILMGVLHQTSPSINWTLKFFNSLIISIGIMFFYFFIKEFFKNQTKALFATFILAIIPCYFSHFIWSLSLSVALFFPAFYCLEMKKHDSKWIFAAVIVIAAILLTQTTTSVHFAFFLAIYVLTKLFFEKKLDILLIIAGPIAGLLAIVLWWGPMYIKYKTIHGLLLGLGQTGVGAILFGEALRFYTWQDFIYVKNYNMINNPVGIGFFLSLLVILSLVSIFTFWGKKTTNERAAITAVLLWLLYAFLSVNGSRLPVRLDYHRSWLIMAIPISIIVVEGLWLLMNLNLQSKIFAAVFLLFIYVIYILMASGFNKEQGTQYFIPSLFILVASFAIILSIFLMIQYLLNQRKLILKDIFKAVLLAEIILLLLITSGYQKYEVNTATWPPGMLWTSYDEIAGYVSLNALPIDTKIFPVCSDSASKLIGFDMLAYPWRNEGATAYKSYNFTSVDEFYSTLKNKGYEYAIIDGGCVQDKNIGINRTNEIIQLLINSTNFKPVQQTQATILFKIL